MHNYTSKDHPKSNAVANSLIQKKAGTTMPGPNRTGMPDNLKAGIEGISGMDMSDVKVHFNSAKPAQLNAFAYAQGNDIHLGAGQEKHLPHEAWHVVQQRQGRVQPTTQLQGQPVNDSASLEAEADTMGVTALQMKAWQSAVSQGVTAATNTIQMVKYESIADPTFTVETFSNGMGAFAQATKKGVTAPVEETKEEGKGVATGGVGAEAYEISSLEYKAGHYMHATLGELAKTGVLMATQTSTMNAYPPGKGVGPLIVAEAMTHLGGLGMKYFQPDIMKTKGGVKMSDLLVSTKKSQEEMEALINTTDSITTAKTYPALEVDFGSTAAVLTAKNLTAYTVKA